MLGLAIVRAWKTRNMQGQVKYYALGLAVLVFGVFQAPKFAGAVPQISPMKRPKAAKAPDDKPIDPMAAAGRAMVENKLQAQGQGAGPDPMSPPAQSQAPAAPQVSSIGELVSMVGMTKAPEKPFENEKETKARDGQAPLSYEALRIGVGTKGGAAKLSGRRAKVKGTVVSMVKVGASMIQILIAEPKDTRRVAYLVTMPRGDEGEFEVGKSTEFTAVFGQAVWKPGSKGTLLLMLGRGLDKWQDEGQATSEIAANFLRPNPAMEAPGADGKAKGSLQAWHLHGQVEDDGKGTAFMSRSDGRKLYAQDGQLVEPGIRVLKIGTEGVMMRVDNHEVTVRPW